MHVVNKSYRRKILFKKYIFRSVRLVEHWVCPKLIVHVTLHRKGTFYIFIHVSRPLYRKQNYHAYKNTLDQLWLNTVNFTEQNNSLFLWHVLLFPMTIVPFFKIIFLYSVCTGQPAECVILHRHKESRVVILLLPYLMHINIEISVFRKQSVRVFRNFV